MKKGGSYFFYPGTQGFMPAQTSTAALAAKGIKYAFFFNIPNLGQINRMGALLESGKVKPVISKTYDIKDITLAYEESAKGHVFGKLAVSI